MKIDFIYFIAFFAFLEFIIIIIFFIKWRISSRKEVDELLSKIQSEQIKYLRDTISTQQRASELLDKRLSTIISIVNENLSKTQGNINQQLHSTGTLLSSVNEKLGELSSEVKRVEKIGEEISTLNDILNAPKLRGGLGEYLLKRLIEDILPENNYSFQYRFRDNTIVDAVIKIKEKLIPIDSKFPYDDFRRLFDSKDGEDTEKLKKKFENSVKKRINEISEKYIKPSEGTLDFALMYIPSESIYYRIISENSEIFEYGKKRKVLPVSPSTLYFYLSTIVMGLRGFKVEEKAKEIINGINELSNELDRFFKEFKTLGTHINNTYQKYSDLLRHEGGIKSKIGALKK